MICKACGLPLDEHWTEAIVACWKKMHKEPAEEQEQSEVKQLKAQLAERNALCREAAEACGILAATIRSKEWSGLADRLKAAGGGD